MQKKKMEKKKKPARKKKAPKTASKKRLQKVNKPPRPGEAAPGEFEKQGSAPKKVICSNMECRLRRAGCYGYEACPGFKAKG